MARHVLRHKGMSEPHDSQQRRARQSQRRTRAAKSEQEQHPKACRSCHGPGASLKKA